MELVIKKAGIEYLEELSDMRIEFIKDLSPEYELELLKKIRISTKNYFHDLFDKKSYIGYLGFLKKKSPALPDS